MAIVVPAVTASCGDDDNPLDPPELGTGGGGIGGSTGTGGPCMAGSSRECHVTIGEHDGVLTCLDGTQQCEGGSWGPCSGSTRTMPKPDTAGPHGEGQYPRPMSLGPPVDCIDNPCDPSCQVFNEDPGPGGVTIPPVVPPYPWTVGDINSLPPSVVDQGTQEPCSTAEDCQFDQYCDNPSGVACSHHPCAPGAGLFPSCSPCAQKICDEDPSCCAAPYAGACEHDPCTAGSALKKDCEPCVTTICNARPGCCGPHCTAPADCAAVGLPTTSCDATGRCDCGPGAFCPTGSTCNASNKCVPSWGSASCQAQVPILCAPKTCPAPNTWTAACAAKVATTCGVSCNTDPPCAHDKCYTGSGLASACDPCVTAICAIDLSCCLTAWTQSCVDKVKTVCAEVCPVKGLCTSWLPGETDPSCPGVDLTVGVPCGGNVPVCNRGNSPVAAGTTIDVVRYPAGSKEIASSDPNQVLTSCAPGPGTVACSFPLPQALPPGECVNVTGCAGLTDGMELMVNPAGANHINECQCENNWSIFQSAMCASPACIASASVSTVKKVTMFVSVDNSTSMQSSNFGCPPPNTNQLGARWTPMKNALNTFFADPESAGLGVALRFWPDVAAATSCHDGACPGPGGGNCSVPHVPLGTLTAAAGDPQEVALINALNLRQPCRETPTYPALDGATFWAINRKTAFPAEEVVIVFITDGIPNGCNTNSVAIAALAQNAFYNHNVRTYVIGFGNTNPTFINQIASAGGGTAFNLTAGAALETSLNNAMKTIRGDFLPCDIAIPVDGISDPSTVDVIYTSGGGVQTTLTPQADPASCGTGWYVDPVDPSIAKLCPATCALIQADVGAKVQAVVPCISSYSALTYSQTYHADCPSGTKVQWGYFTYESTTPSDTNIEFEVRSAETAAGLSAATTTTAATAHAAPTNTQVCDLAQAPPCFVDLYTTLGGLPDARNDYLELIMTLNPSSDGQQAPTVQDWEITYSCPDSE